LGYIIGACGSFAVVAHTENPDDIADDTK